MIDEKGYAGLGVTVSARKAWKVEIVTQSCEVFETYCAGLTEGRLSKEQHPRKRPDEQQARFFCQMACQKSASRMSLAQSITRSMQKGAIDEDTWKSNCQWGGYTGRHGGSPRARRSSYES
eukprot:763913-Hanusia_phi.AAC.1